MQVQHLTLVTDQGSVFSTLIVSLLRTAVVAALSRAITALDSFLLLALKIRITHRAFSVILLSPLVELGLKRPSGETLLLDIDSLNAIELHRNHLFEHFNIAFQAG